jgi:hypothetical protein
MMRDLASKIVPVTVFGPVTLAADNTPAAIDLAGFHSAVLLLGIGVGGITFDSTNKIEFKLTHSDDNSSYSDVTDADMQGVTGITSGIIKSLVAAHAAAAVYEFGYVGNKRYLKLLADFSGTHGTGTPLHACLVKGNGVYKP